MDSHGEPLVSVVTPVYNGEEFLAECIESVMAQTYSNWEYIIVDNCSTDGTRAVAERFARMDKRIRVYQNDRLLDIISNHNRAFRLISPDSKYCKVVSADDWIFPECLARMVCLAERNPSVGIVGSHQLSGAGTNWRQWSVRWTQLPYPSPIVPGREVCRSWLLHGIYVFGSPTSVLYRASLVRANDPFYPNLRAEADTSACLKHLSSFDFGFVHQVLSYERLHHRQVSEISRKLNGYALSRIADLRNYGPLYLTEEELEERLDQVLHEYYAYLAISAVNFREKGFWDHHKDSLKEIGYPLSSVRLAKAIGAKVLDLLCNPKQTLERLVRRRTPQYQEFTPR